VFCSGERDFAGGRFARDFAGGRFAREIFWEVIAEILLGVHC
jgi:hypothetical protein